MSNNVLKVVVSKFYAFPITAEDSKIYKNQELLNDLVSNKNYRTFFNMKVEKCDKLLGTSKVFTRTFNPVVPNYIYCKPFTGKTCELTIMRNTVLNIYVVTDVKLVKVES